MANLTKVDPKQIIHLGALSSRETLKFLSFEEIEGVYIDEELLKYLGEVKYLSGLHVKMKEDKIPIAMLEYFKDCDELWQEEGNMFWVWWD